MCWAWLGLVRMKLELGHSLTVSMVLVTVWVGIGWLVVAAAWWEVEWGVEQVGWGEQGKCQCILHELLLQDNEVSVRGRAHSSVVGVSKHWD